MAKREQVIPVDEVEVAGTAIMRPTVDPLVRDLANIARALSKRVISWDKNNDESEGMPLAVVHAAGVVDRIVRGLLAEQRARAQMTHGRPPLSDDEYADEMREIEDRGVRTMPRERLERLLAERPRG